jgi:phage pi2 protein 07
LTSPGRPFEHPGYNFDFCSSDVIYKVRVKGGRIYLPDGMNYSFLVLPRSIRMTPKLLRKIGELIKEGATVIGAPPLGSPSLEDYPRCDEEISRLRKEIWGGDSAPQKLMMRKYGKGKIIWGGNFSLDEGKGLSPLIETAKWIWYPEGNPLQAVPPNIVRFFRKDFEIQDKPVESARFLITADNEFKCYINGKLVGEGNKWEEIYNFDAKRFLKEGKDEIWISARNGGDIPNPAGLICALLIYYKDGDVKCVVSDRSWESAISDVWVPAMELGPYGDGPWGNIGSFPLYFDIEQICQLLRNLGIPPDFSYEPRKAPGSIRYIHRRLPDAEVYFVANQEPREIRINCFFRLKGRLPEIWLPESGKIMRPEKFKETKEGTVVSLYLKPLESVSVVFPKTSSRSRWLALEVKRKPALEKEIKIEGEWEMRFPKGWGAPERIIFPELISWSQHSDEGIKYFSGTAVYKKVFSLPQNLYRKDKRYILNLGDVKVIAEVMLNGRNLGTLWKAPYEVDATEAIRPGENELLLKVTNLWVNRMIGDEFLPEDSKRNPDGTLERWPDWLLAGKKSPTGRFTFTTWRLWSKNDPLQPSGLLGPVKLSICH